jgi:hypothetical protein
MGATTSSNCCLNRPSKECCMMIDEKNKVLFMDKNPRPHNRKEIPGMVVCERELRNDELDNSSTRNNLLDLWPFSVSREDVSERRNSLSRSPGLPDTKDNKISNLAWRQDPHPPKGWTQRDQRVLLSELEQNPFAKRNPEHLKRLFERTHLAIPHKTIAEIETCFKHIERTRIAYFGPITKKLPRNRSMSLQRI